MRNWSLSLIVLGATSALVGCSEDVDSSAIRTKGMYANYSAIATGDGKTKVSAELRVGGDDGTYVILEKGDTLEGSAGDAKKKLGASSDGRNYSATFDGDDGGTLFTIAFERGEDEDAPDSRVTLPEPFTLSLVEDGTDVKVVRGTEVPIAWDPAGSGSVEWSVSGDCVWSRSGTTDDDGEFSIPGDEIEVTGTDEGETCEVTVALERISKGSVDPAFEEGGQFLGIQHREVRFSSTPAASETK